MIVFKGVSLMHPRRYLYEIYNCSENELNDFLRIRGKSLSLGVSSNRVNLSTNGVKKIRKSFEDPRVFFSILGLTVERLFKPFTFLVSSIEDNKTIHFYRNYFSRILSVPSRRTSKRNFGSPKQIREKNKRPITTVCLGLPKFRLRVLRLGTLRIREKIISIEMGCFVILYKSVLGEIKLRFPI